jgi:hypothetical protein
LLLGGRSELTEEVIIERCCILIGLAQGVWLLLVECVVTLVEGLLLTAFVLGPQEVKIKASSLCLLATHFVLGLLELGLAEVRE